MNRKEIAEKINNKETFQLGEKWVFITEIIEGPLTFVTFNINGKNAQSLWIGELIDLIQELEVPASDKCRKCKGTGSIEAHIRVQGGRCFRCEGTGRESRHIENKKEAAYRKSPEGRAAYAAHLKEIRKSNSLY